MSLQKPRRGRIPLRETLQANQRALDIYAAMSGKPRYEIPIPAAPVKRAPSNRSENPYEVDVQREILDALKRRSDVVFVGRFNSGTSMDTNAHGETRYTRFNTVPGFTDIHGMMTAGRAFYVEVKRPIRPTPVTKDQQEFMERVRKGGGLVGVANSVQQAHDILDSNIPF